jgi:type IV secretory pathway VirJ component
VAQVSLLGLGSYAELEFHVEEWLSDEPSKDALPVLPELERLDLSLVQCFYGEEEEDTLCPSPRLKGVEVIRTGGGHHFGGDYQDLAKTILDGARRRLSAGWQPSIRKQGSLLRIIGLARIQLSNRAQR